MKNNLSQEDKLYLKKVNKTLSGKTKYLVMLDDYTFHEQKDPSRIYPLLYKIGDLWIKYPNSRFGQLINNIVNDNNLFYIEDEEFEEKIKEYKEKNK